MPGWEGSSSVWCSGKHVQAGFSLIHIDIGRSIVKESPTPWMFPSLCWRATNCFRRTEIKLDCLSLSLSGCNLYLTLKDGNAFTNRWWHPSFSKLFSQKNEKYPSITVFLTSKSHCLSNSCFESFSIRLNSQSLILRTRVKLEWESDWKKDCLSPAQRNVEHYFLFFFVGCRSEPIKQS